MGLDGELIRTARVLGPIFFPQQGRLGLGWHPLSTSILCPGRTVNLVRLQQEKIVSCGSAVPASDMMLVDLDRWLLMYEHAPHTTVHYGPGGMEVSMRTQLLLVDSKEEF